MRQSEGVAMSPDVQAAEPGTLHAGSFRDQLRAAGILVPSGVDGVQGWSGAFLVVMDALRRLTVEVGTDLDATRIEFPPVLPRQLLERNGYLKSFPQLAGVVNAFTGDDHQHAELYNRLAAGDDWAALLAPVEVALTPAACHPLYPTQSGPLPPGGRHFDVHGWCFRHEPSLDPARAQAFRMHEYVFLGAPDAALGVRDLWVDRGLDLLGGLGLEVDAVVANDAFFGKAGGLLAQAQRRSALKLEVVAPIDSADRPTAIMSANYHRDHFGLAFAITTHDGAVAHSACVGFGMERIVLALLRRHGLDPTTWPRAVRTRLWA
jgi:seryl-tRNA synthetase